MTFKLIAACAIMLAAAWPAHGQWTYDATNYFSTNAAWELFYGLRERAIAVGYTEEDFTNGVLGEFSAVPEPIPNWSRLFLQRWDECLEWILPNYVDTNWYSYGTDDAWFSSGEQPFTFPIFSGTGTYNNTTLLLITIGYDSNCASSGDCYFDNYDTNTETMMYWITTNDYFQRKEAINRLTLMKYDASGWGSVPDFGTNYFDRFGSDTLDPTNALATLKADAYTNFVADTNGTSSAPFEELYSQIWRVQTNGYQAYLDRDSWDAVIEKPFSNIGGYPGVTNFSANRINYLISKDRTNDTVNFFEWDDHGSGYPEELVVPWTTNSYTAGDTNITYEQVVADSTNAMDWYSGSISTNVDYFYWRGCYILPVGMTFDFAVSNGFKFVR